MTSKPPRSGGKAVPIQWSVGDFTPTYYATNMVAQVTDHEYIISFFELYPPLLVGTPEEVSEQATGMNNVTANCLARIVIAADRMPGIVDALQSIVSRANELSDEE